MSVPFIQATVFDNSALLRVNRNILPGYCHCRHSSANGCSAATGRRAFVGAPAAPGEWRRLSASSAPQLAADHTNPEAAQSRAATRIALRPHDPGTGEEIDKREIVKGYEYGRGQFVTLTPEELKALDVAMSSSEPSKRGSPTRPSLSSVPEPPMSLLASPGADPLAKMLLSW